MKKGKDHEVRECMIHDEFLKKSGRISKGKDYCQKIDKYGPVKNDDEKWWEFKS